MTGVLKRSTSVLLVMAMCISTFMCLFSLLSFDVSAEASQDHTYQASNFSALPEDWVLLAGSDTKNAPTPTCSNGAVKLHHNNPSDGTVTGPYWGAVWEIAKGQVWSDFTFKMDFTLSNPNNESRYIHVLFHTKNESYLSGHGFVHKVNNSMKKSLQTSSDTEAFDEINSSETAPLTLDTPHTMIITMSGNIAKYYLDGVLLSEYDVSTKGDARTDGGFAINLNGCAVKISSLTITDEILDFNAAPSAPASAVYTAQQGLAEYRADGTLTINARNAVEVPARYRVFWGNKDGKLSGYNAFADITPTGTTTTFKLKANTLVPEGADRLLVYSFSSSNGKLSEACAVAMLNGKTTNLGQVKKEVQILGDIHITSDQTHTYNQNFIAALNDIKSVSPNTSGIFINGDIADGDMEDFNKPFADQYVLFNNTVKNAGFADKVFPVSGNHDFFAWGSLGVNTQRDQNCIEQFLEGTGLEDMYYYKDIGGSRFIMLSSLECRNDNKAYLGQEQREWFEEALKTAPNGPIFVFLHQPLKSTVAYDNYAVSVEDEAFLRETLAEYPEAILFSGHSHERMEVATTMYASNGITAFGTSAVAYICQDGSRVGGEGSQGYYLYFYEDKLVIKGRDFINGTWIPEAQFVLEIDPVVESGESTTPPNDTDKPTQPESPTETNSNAGDTNNNTNATDSNTSSDVPKKNKGCGSTIGGATILFVALTSLGVCVFKRKAD